MQSQAPAVADSELDFRPALRPPRFGLSFLFGVFVALAICFAAHYYWGAMGLSAAALIFSVVGAHVLGNSLGVQLRDNGSQVTGTRKTNEPTKSIAFAPQTSLGERRRVTRTTLTMSVIFGGLSALLGLAIFATVYGAKISWLVLALGAGAFFVLGTLAAFIVVTFVSEAIQAIGEASKQD